MSLDHEKWMRLAIEEGERARGTTGDNPWVGCVIVSPGGELLGRGHTLGPGEDHAEIAAARDAHTRGHGVVGATLYSTLEPCSFHGRTPACSTSIAERGIARVVIGMRDPHPRVDGAGIAILRSADVEVIEGVCEADVRRQLGAWVVEQHPRETLRRAETQPEQDRVARLAEIYGVAPATIAALLARRTANVVSGLLMLAVVCLGTVQPALAQQASPFGSIGVGMSVTPDGDDPGGPLIGPGVGGTAAALAADAGLWANSRFGVAGEASLAWPFEVQQTEGGVGRCCSALTREHRLTFFSGVAKVRLVPRLILQGGVGGLRIATNEVRVTTPIGGSTRAPVASTFSKTRFAWTIGAEAEIPVSPRLQLVPAARVYVSRVKDEIAELNPLALGSTTFRVTVSIRASGVR